jgi:Peptidase family M23
MYIGPAITDIGGNDVKKQISKVIISLVLLISLFPMKQAFAASSFIMPAEGSITSTYKDPEYKRIFGKDHYGIDIAKSGTVPIYASADGTVKVSTFGTSGNYGGYGNVIIISHNIGGVYYETLYAHMSSRTVSVNNTVKQGQLIGYMGSTGESTGQHLHFELHKGTWNGYKSNSVDPLSLLDLELLEWYEKPLNDGQVGWIQISKPIVLWKRNADGLEAIKDLEPGAVYRVYGYDNQYGGQFNVGGGYYITKIEDNIEYKNAPLYFKGIEFKRNQKGLLTIDKSIVLWERNSNDDISYVRTLEPGEQYRVYGYDDKHGGQYNVGDGQWVTNMPDHITYETPSKDFLNLAERRIYFD